MRRSGSGASFGGFEILAELTSSSERASLFMLGVVCRMVGFVCEAVLLKKSCGGAERNVGADRYRYRRLLSGFEIKEGHPSSSQPSIASFSR